MNILRSCSRGDENVHLGVLWVRAGAPPGGRGLHPAAQQPSPVLVVAPPAEQPSPQTLRRLAHEYSLAAELDPAWAVWQLRVQTEAIQSDVPTSFAPHR